jgi:hypothetical protein
MKYEGTNIEEGKQLLHNYLTSIATPESIATYTLTVYDRLPADKRLTSKTPYDASFNFKLHETGQAPGQIYRHQELEQLRAMIEELRAELNEREEPEERSQGIMGAVQDMLAMPQVQQAIVGKVLAFVDKVFPGAPAMGAPPQLGKVAGMGESNTDIQLPAAGDPASAAYQDYMQQLSLTNAAWNTLYERDAKIGEHLMKLSQLALRDPAQFTMLVGMIEKL